jgi:uncharacterized membrane protein
MMQNDPKISVLLAGESWVSTGMHVKGFDRFATAEYQIGIETLKRALEGSDIALTHLPGHLVPTDFPSTIVALAKFDVIALSDIGANSLLLHPDTFVRGLRTPNRLSLIADWVKGGGGFLMVGGYLSFQGIDGIARYHRTPIERLLPVEMLPVDDRMEVPEGFTPVLGQVKDHAILAGIGGDWPYLLGYNETRPKPEATVLLKTGAAPESHPLLAVGAYGAGRTMAWTSDIGPHWLPESFSTWSGYARLWRQAFAWLAFR